MKRVAAWAAVGVMLSGGAVAQSSVRMNLTCQKNLSDGRILVSDGRLLPDNARFKVISYRETSRDGGWSQGPCVLDVTKGGSR